MDRIESGNLAQMISKHRWFLVCALFYLILGIGLGLYMNSEGIGVSPDSVAYLASARSLVAGEGLSIPDGIGEPTPMTHFGPLYPTLLGIFGYLGLDVAEVARFLSAVFLGILLLVVAGLVYFAAPNGSIGFLLAPLLILVSEDILEVHRYAFSEPPYLILTALGLFAFVRFIQTSTKWTLIASLGLLGLAGLTRYAGLASIPTIFLGLLLFRRSSWQKEFPRALFASLLTSLPVGLWFLRNWIVSGNPTDRGFAVHPISMEKIRTGLETVSNWILPGRVAGPARELLAVLFLSIVFLSLIYMVFRSRRGFTSGKESNGNLTLTAIAGLYIICYWAMLVFTISFVDAQLSLTPRPLTPIYVFGVIAFFSVLPLSFKTETWLRSGLTIAGILFVLAFNGIHALKYVSRAHDGSMMMYAGDGWQAAEIIYQVRGLPEGVPIYSNGDDAIYFAASRPAARLPQKVDPFTSQVDMMYQSNLDHMRTILADRNGLIVYFNGITWRGYLPTKEELEAALSLVVVWSGEQGVIYGVR